ncbi:MAG: T9SS type A sorting domain-containing protein [Bacteroidetes bacterium]|nr:T9SS type A sorting domain-containing protein [Bacteroidota bacterium]
MIQKLLCLIVFVFTITDIQAQITFQKKFGASYGEDLGRSIQSTSDGGYIIAGYSRQSGTNLDIKLIKTNSIGDSLWVRTFGGPLNEEAKSVRQTTDGGYIIAGYTKSFGSGNSDALLMKIDSTGNLLWTKTYGGTDVETANWVQQTTDGGYILFGNVTTLTSNGDDTYLIKTNASGDSLWTRTIGTNAGDNNGNYVQQTNDGGYILAGTMGNINGNNVDVFLAKTNSLGSVQWIKMYGGPVADYGNYVQTTTDGGYVLFGSTCSFHMSIYDFYMVKTDANGDSLWTRKVSGGYGDYGTCMMQTTDGGYIVAGNSANSSSIYDILLLKMDANGDSIWSKTIGVPTGNEFPYEIAQTQDGGYIISGYMGIAFGGKEVYMIKTDANGNSGCNQGSKSLTITSTPSIKTIPNLTTVNFTTTITSPVFTIGSGGTITTPCTSVSLSEQNANTALDLYPNPTQRRFTVSFGKTIANGQLEILNIQGSCIKSVYHLDLSGESEKSIELINYVSGIYLVRVFDGEKYISRKMILTNM